MRHSAIVVSALALALMTGSAGISSIAAAQEATPEPTAVEGFMPIAVEDTLVAICATCDPTVEVDYQVVDGVEYAEYTQDSSVPGTTYNFFVLAPLASWCTDAGGTFQLNFDRGAIMRIPLPDEPIVCGYTPETVSAWLSYPDHAYFAAVPPEVLREVIGHPDAFILAN